jgi:UDP-glucuronate decarboxylase
VSYILETDAKEVVSRLANLDVSGSSVILTGASGVIGISLIAALNELARSGRGPELIVAVSKQNTPRKTSASSAHIEYQTMDLIKSGWKQLLPRADFVIHAAGYGQPAKFMADPLTTLKLNTFVTAELIDCLSPHGRFLFASSSEIYSGLTGSSPTETETGTTTPSHPRAPYIEAKRCGETICNAVLGQRNCHINARIALAYGPGAYPDDERVLYSFIRQALNGKVVRVKGAGLARRTYCYVSDMSEVLLKLLFNRDCYGTYNVGGVSEISIRDLAAMVADLTDADLVLDADDDTVLGAPNEVRLDLRKMQSETGKSSYVSLVDGLSRTIQWWKETYL